MGSASRTRSRHASGSTIPGFDLAVAAEFNTVEAFAKGLSGLGRLQRGNRQRARRDPGGGGPRLVLLVEAYDVEGPPDGRYLEAAETILKACRHLIIGEGGYDQKHFLDGADPARCSSPWIRSGTCAASRAWSPGTGSTAPGATTRYGLWTADGSPQVIDLLGPLHPTPTP